MNAAEIARHLKGRPLSTGGYLCHCPVPSHGRGRGDRNPSLTVADGDKGPLVDCKCGCDPRDVLAAVGYQPGQNGRAYGANSNGSTYGNAFSAYGSTFGFNTAPRQEKREQASDKRKPFYDGHLTSKGYRLVSASPYEDKHDDWAVLYEVVRYEHPTKGKEFLQRSPDGRGGWLSGAGDRKVLYRWRDLDAFAHTHVFVTEGEKDADRLASHGILAVTVASGAWSQEAIEALHGYECFILEDNDKTGREKALKAAKALHGVAASIRIVRLPGLAEGEDVSDWLDQGGNVASLAEIAAAAPEWQSGEEEADEAGDTTGDALPFEGFEDLQVSIKKTWAIKNVLALGETSSWIGSPGAGKSALLTSVAVHVADQRDWRDYKAKRRFAVIYLAFERGDLLKRRLEAYKMKYSLSDLPIAVVTAPVDIMSPGCIPILVATIRAVAAKYGIDAGLLIIDTFAKAIALGGGDEDKAKDQNRVLGHLREVQRQTAVHVALIGHTGKDETRGARGSNAHLGDVDMMVQLSGDTVKTATITKANDQPEGVLTSFSMESFPLGHDEDGDPVTVGVISEDVPDRTDQRSGPIGPRPSDQQRVALDALRYALSEAGERPPASNHIPHGVTAVKWDVACRYLDQAGITSSDDPRRIYDKIRDALKAKKVIRFWKPWLWIEEQADPIRTKGREDQKP